MKQEINKYIQELNEVIKENNLKGISDYDILDFAFRYLISNNIEKGKNQRTEKIKEKNSKGNKGVDSATKPQIAYLKKHNLLKDMENLSKQEAFMLIKKHKEGII